MKIRRVSSALIMTNSWWCTGRITWCSGTVRHSTSSSSSKNRPLLSAKNSEQVSHSDPMQRLSRVLLNSKHALFQHRELIKCLSEGDAERAADVAAALAQIVKNFTVSSNDTQSSVTKNLPFCNSDTVVKSMEKLSSFLESTPNHMNDDVSEEKCGDIEKSWHSADSLRITVLESVFETLDPDDSSSLDTPDESNVKMDMEILDRYLLEQANEWKLQKKHLGLAILKASKSIGLTPADLHAHETSPVPISNKEKLKPLKHVNVVVRGEVPETCINRLDRESNEFEGECLKSLQALKKRMELQGSPLSEIEEKMALFELLRSKTSMRYSVGIHHSVQRALDESKAVKRHMLSSESKCKTGSEYFVSTAIQLLNQDSETRAQEDEEKSFDLAVIEKPVIPFTFMLKCCLWFEI